MSTISILNQDRDTDIIYNCEGNKPNLYTEPVFRNDTLIGINLLAGGILLGTFDSTGEAIQEISNILKCEDCHYEVSGFEDWGEYDEAPWTKVIEALTLIGLMKEGRFDEMDD